MLPQPTSEATGSRGGSVACRALTALLVATVTTGVACRVLAALLVAVLAAAASVAPAAAHGTAEGEASNYRTVLTEVPTAPGFSATLITGGALLEVSYDGPGTLVVAGYADEPYLRMSRDGGLEENIRSPATYLNDTADGEAPVPDDADPHAPPEWRMVSAEPVARWHDHRAHWMGVADPPIVTAEPDRAHTIISQWTIPLDIDGRAAVLVGDVVWEPGPPWWQWPAVALVIAAAVAALGWYRRTRPVPITAPVALTLLAGAGWYLMDSGPVGPPLWVAGGLALSVAATWAAYGLGRAGRTPAALATLGAGALGVGGFVGLVNGMWLLRSQLPTDASPLVARTLIATAMGVALGLAAVSLARVASGPPRPASPVASTSKTSAPSPPDAPTPATPTASAPGAPTASAPGAPTAPAPATADGDPDPGARSPGASTPVGQGAVIES